MAEIEINGHAANIAVTTPNALKRLNDADELLREYNKDSDQNYLFDEEFRGKYLKAVADVVLEYQEDGVSPGEDFYADGDFPISHLQEARTAFLARGGMISSTL